MATKQELGPEPEHLGIPGKFIRFSEFVSKVSDRYPGHSLAFMKWFLSSIRDRNPGNLQFVSMDIAVEEDESGRQLHTAWYVNIEGVEPFIEQLACDKLFLNQDSRAINKRFSEAACK